MEIAQINRKAFILAAELEDVTSDTDADASDSVSAEGEQKQSDLESGTDVNEEEEESSESDADQEETEPETVEFLPSAPLPVYLVDNPEESSIELYTVSGSAYPGTISTTYLDYFEGIADNLGYGENYVIFRESQYYYKMFWGKGLEESNGYFTGSGLNYCSIYTGSGSNNMAVSRGTDSLAFSAGTGFVYSSLGDFPGVTKGGTHIETLAILFALGFFVVYNVCHDIFDYIMEHVYRK